MQSLHQCLNKAKGSFKTQEKRQLYQILSGLWCQELREGTFGTKWMRVLEKEHLEPLDRGIGTARQKRDCPGV